MQASHGAARVVALSLLIAMAGCSPDPAAPISPDQASADPPAKNDDDAPVAESSLAIKRGVMKIAEERSTFTPCGGKGELWVLDQSPGMLTQTLIEGQQTAPVSLYVEAYGERAPAEESPEAQGFEGIFVLEEILYAGMPGEIGGCDAPAPTYVVLARGNEPFWSVEVRDDRMIWRQPEAPTEIQFGQPQTINAEGAVRYTVSVADHELELMVHAQACQDSMSGEYFAYTAKALLDGREFNGCARVGR
jgi:uncharacterized membrane protein